MKRYVALVEIAGILEKIEFETDDLPVKWLWNRFGMSCYIEDVREYENPVETIKMEVDLVKET